MKKCFKCGEEKELKEFYKHKQMADGHLNKCKICTRKDSRSNYDEKSKDEDWFLKERERTRLKYHRLNYKDKVKDQLTKYPWKKSSEYKNLRKKHYPFLDKNIELHHWNYFKIKDVILLDRRTHSKLHSLLEIDVEKRIFFVKDTGEYLDTRIKHEKFIKDNFRHG